MTAESRATNCRSGAQYFASRVTPEERRHRQGQERQKGDDGVADKSKWEARGITTRRGVPMWDCQCGYGLTTAWKCTVNMDISVCTCLCRALSKTQEQAQETRMRMRMSMS
jgi:hypothetical protein